VLKVGKRSVLLIASTGTCCQCCGSGSGWNRIILPDPDRHPGHADFDSADPEGYGISQFQGIKKLLFLTFFQRIGIGFFIPIRILIWIGINMEIRIRIGFKTIAIHNTACTVIVYFLL
jgi:hypothetical protein